MEEREVELIDYINVIVKRKWMILTGTLVCVCAAAIYGFAHRVPTLYEAKASLLVTPPPYKTDLTPPAFSLAVYEKLARAQDLEKAVIDSLRLRDYSAGSLDGMLTIDMVKETTSPLITFTLKTGSPDLSLRVANAWAELFVRRNSGITQRTMAGSYDFIVSQYEMTKKRLEETEDGLLQFKGTSPLPALSTEKAAETAKLSETQAAYVNQRVDLQAKEDILAQESSMLSALEVDGKWLGAAMEEGRRPSTVGLTEDQRNIRQLALNAIAEAARTSEDTLGFQGQRGLNQIRAEVEKKVQALGNFQADLVNMSLSRETTRVNLEQVEKQMQGQAPTLVLSKAITDGALWERVRGGAPTPEDVRQLEALKLRSEELNPVYMELLKRKADLMLERDSYEPREKVLREEVEKLKEGLPDLQERLQAEQRRWAGLVKRAEAARSVYNAFIERYASAKAGTGKLRLEIAAIKNQVSSTRAAVESAGQRVLGLDDEIARLQTSQARLERDASVYKSSFDRFAKLAEDARIAKASEVSDLKFVMPAVEASPVTTNRQNTILLSGAVGLMLSVFLAFLMEYLEKARAAGRA